MRITDTEAPNLVEINPNLENAEASSRLKWAHEQFGDGLVLSTSFGAQSAVMLHLVSREIGRIPVIFIDTGYLFPETYQYANELCQALDLDLRVFNPLMTPGRQEALFGKRWEQGKEALEAYNRDNKVEPMNRALLELGATAWLSGLRRVQSTTRQNLEIVQKQKRTYKIHPIVDWTEKDIYYYMKDHDLPFHPLWEKGYVSIGDWHSTVPLGEGMDAEETRFNGLKRECGLHEDSGQADWQI